MKIKVLINVLFTAIIAIAAYFAVSNVLQAKEIEKAISGGYDSLLEYENRNNSDTFISKEGYVSDKSFYYRCVVRDLYRTSTYEFIGCIMMCLIVIWINIWLYRVNKKTDCE